MRRTNKIIYKLFIITFKKKVLRYFFKRYKNANGQVLVEYILLTIVTLAVMGAFMKAFSEAQYTYLQRVFGGGERDYLGCLLREGQLPQLGSKNRVAGACRVYEFGPTNAPNVPNAITPPNPIIPPPPVIPPDPIIAPLSEAPRSRIPPDAIAPPDSGIPPDQAPPTGSRGGSGIRSGGGQQNLIPIGGSDRAFGNQKLSNRGTSRQNKRIILASKSEKAQANSLFEDSPNNIRNNTRNTRIIKLSKKTKNNLALGNQASTPEQGIRSASTKKVIPLAENKILTSVEDKPWSWNFGFIIKYLMIIAVILIVLLLIGGQFLQIKKGLEGSR